jgi:signal transduction histidine kinase/ligand-binding sensor domain-containing protein
MISYKNDPLETNSLASNVLESICIDSTGIVWIGTAGKGLESFDPAKGIFKHHQHQPNNPNSIGDSSVYALMTDHHGTLWIATGKGLDRYDPATNSFVHYRHVADDTTSISSNTVAAIYEDRQGIIWVGTGSPYNRSQPTNGGLNRLDRKSGKFTRYKNEPGNPYSLIDNRIKAIYEDSKGNFWIGTAGDGLHTMNRANGTFQRHRYDPNNPQKLSRPPINKVYAETDHITFIREDAAAGFWIGTAEAGMNYYNPKTATLTHYELNKDTVGAFTDRSLWYAYTSRDGVFWLSTINGHLYRVNTLKKTIPFFPMTEIGVNSLDEEPDGTLWIATERGLYQYTRDYKLVNHFVNNPKDVNSLSDNSVQALKQIENNKMWIATIGGGLQLFDKKRKHFTTYRNNPANKSSLCNDNVLTIYEDPDKNLWLGTFRGLDKLDPKTGIFSHFLFYPEDTIAFGSNTVTSVLKDSKGRWWASCWMKGGVQLFNVTKGRLKTYLKGITIIRIYEDSKGELWAGGEEGLFRYNSRSDAFDRFVDPLTGSEYNTVRSFIEDDQGNLWLSAHDGIIKIPPDRKESIVYGTNYGINGLNLSYGGSYKGQNGKLYFGDINGYYSFSPKDLVKNEVPVEIVFSNFRLANRVIQPMTNSILPEPLSTIKRIRLRHNQNVFSFEFAAIDYANPEENQHFFMLENYDNEWRQSGSDHRALYFNVPPGKYTFRVKALNDNGGSGEKTVAVVISPPWWNTLFAYILFAVVITVLLWSIIHYRSRSLLKEKQRLEKKVYERTEEVVKQKEEIAVQRDNLKEALDELKSTQIQLVQKEKMASLGELTAGIAHEIQNPLNFVNNFSEVNNELLNEMRTELMNDNKKEAIALAEDVKQNLEKIIYHGKRADAIVKAMLQHSRSSSGVKEPTDLNKMTDEYLRLAYHGVRAKDQSFNVKLKTHFDESIGDINIIPQDIGRVILNLATNAFYAVSEKKKQLNQGYDPVVSVNTRKTNESVEIRVIDNGNGIPEELLTKIFQPFFTTKPTGQGTGLGLSLSYDIVKAHGGDIKVSTKEADGTEFIIVLPIKSVI